jgi:multiple sugar transport system substrate-binding protein
VSTRKLRVVVAVAAGALLAGCAQTTGGVPTLEWYVTPDNGSYAKIAKTCETKSGNAYRLKVSVLPNDASGQREQLVRRLAAKDSSIDLMSLDPPFVPEFAEAGFLRPFKEQEAAKLTDGMLRGAVESGHWKDKLYAAPFRANTQLLWFRKSVAQQAGLDMTKPHTWTELTEAAERTKKTFAVQGKRYEGLMVWVNALIEGAGGEVVTDVEKGADLTPTLNTPAGHAAAQTMRRLGRSPAAPANLSTSIEEDTRTAFQNPTGGFMANWTYAQGAAREAVEKGTLNKAVLDDYGWARYPRTEADKPSRPPFGGVSLGVGAYSKHPDLAVQALNCVTDLPQQIDYMKESKETTAKAAVYDDPGIRADFPMADLVRESLNDAGPRPRTPYYNDVSSAVQRVFHPPAAIDPDRAPKEADALIRGVLHDKVLL